MTKLSQLKIDPEFQNQINPPSFEETHQLEMNILKEERVLNPIITWNGYIVDGHTRYQILRKYPFIPFEVIEKEFSIRNIQHYFNGKAVVSVWPAYDGTIQISRERMILLKMWLNS